MINYYGYPAELHQVVTADGHLLELHRIPGRKANLSVPVILQHGIASSSADFLGNKPPNNLGKSLSRSRSITNGKPDRIPKSFLSVELNVP